MESGVQRVSVIRDAVKSVVYNESNESDDNASAEHDADLEETPETSPEKFKPVRGTKGKENIETGEIYEKDQLHKDHYEVYKNKRAYERGVRGSRRMVGRSKHEKKLLGGIMKIAYFS